MSTNVISYHYFGGLGDVLLKMKRDGFRYNLISEMGPEERAYVFLTSPNPGACDFFTKHPKASQIKLAFNPWGPRPDGAATHWAFWAHRNRTPRNATDLDLFPTQSDLEAIASLPEPHIVVSASAAGKPRSFPESVTSLVIAKAIEHGFTPVFVGARYAVNGRYPYLEKFTHHREWGPPEAPGVVSLIDRLTVPGTLYLIKRAAGLISCYSSMFVGGMVLRKNQLTLVPTSIKRSFERNRPWVPEVLTERTIRWHCWEDPGTDRMLDRYLRRIKAERPAAHAL